MAKLLTNREDIEQLLATAHLNLGRVDNIQVYNSLLSPSEDYDNPVMEFIAYMSKPENFWFTCKYLFNIELLPFQLAILQELWVRKSPMLIATRGGGKTWILALYAILRAIFHQGAKVVVVGAAFRQSKFLFEYMESFYQQSPIFQSIVGNRKHEGPKRDIDRCNFYIGDSEIIAIPLGDGTKIRGLRANYIIADEFASIPQEIYEVVIKGFGSVSADPVSRVKDFAQIAILKSLGMYVEADEMEEGMGFGNQTVISGTAYYAFNHFYDYFQRYRNIVRSKGDQRYLEEYVFKGPVPENFDWTHFSVIRLPHTLLPRGFMDEAALIQSQAILHSARFNMEYGAVFARDSEGFYRRTMIEMCVTNEPVSTPDGDAVTFDPLLRGNPNKRYIFGIDPASEKDNFSIVILELNGFHRRVVYCWTVTRQSMRKRLNSQGADTQQSFYNYCARKIRDLMKIFPTEHIAMDAQGGGISIMEALHDSKNMEPGEHAIWPYIKDPNNEKDPFYWEKEGKPTDGEPGLHILHMVEFASADFTFNANHNLRKDLETHSILFPKFDTVLLAEAIATDKSNARIYDTLEDNVVEIEALKDELTTIQHSQTPTGRDHWDTPETIEAGGKRGRLRKDRFSALLMANEVAHVLVNVLESRPHTFVGGYAGQQSSKKSGRLFIGPEHLVSQMTGTYGMGVRRR